MKLNEMNIFVFLACMIVGILIAMNLNFGFSGQIKTLTAVQYQEAINDRSKLYNDISMLEKQYNDNRNRLYHYNVTDPSEEGVINNLKSELEMNKRILGIDEVQGSGVIITLNDASTSFQGEVEDDDSFQWAKIVHNTDVLAVVNYLRDSGTEAISINGQRIMTNSEFYCWGPFLKINGVNIGAPFYISAIGNGDNIKKYLYSDDGYLTFLKYRGVFVEFEKEDNVKIPAYIGNPNTQFMKEVKNN